MMRDREILYKGCQNSYCTICEKEGHYATEC